MTRANDCVEKKRVPESLTSQKYFQNNLRAPHNLVTDLVHPPIDVNCSSDTFFLEEETITDTFSFRLYSGKKMYNLVFGLWKIVWLEI